MITKVQNKTNFILDTIFKPVSGYKLDNLFKNHYEEIRKFTDKSNHYGISQQSFIKEMEVALQKGIRGEFLSEKCNFGLKLAAENALEK